MYKTPHIRTNFSSLNFDERSKAIDTIVIHSTHRTFRFAVKRLCDKESKVSCHYIINLDGEIYQLVKDQKIAWHAGKSYWQGRTDLNGNSIGIELVDINDDRIAEYLKTQCKYD